MASLILPERVLLYSKFEAGNHLGTRGPYPWSRRHFASCGLWEAAPQSAPSRKAFGFASPDFAEETRFPPRRRCRGCRNPRPARPRGCLLRQALQLATDLWVVRRSRPELVGDSTREVPSATRNFGGLRQSCARLATFRSELLLAPSCS